MFTTIVVQRVAYHDGVNLTRHLLRSNQNNCTRTTRCSPKSAGRIQHVQTSWQRDFSTTQSPQRKPTEPTPIEPQPQEDSNEIPILQATSPSNNITNHSTQSSNTTPTRHPSNPTSSSSSSSSSHTSLSSSSSSSSSHNSLSSFLTYAMHTSVSKTSTTYLGTLYEYLILNHFTHHLSFNLTRTGGRNDTGIDLIGTWSLPSILASSFKSQSHSSISPPSPLQQGQQSQQTPHQPTPTPTPIIIQCKRLTTTTPGPNLIRELEGSFRGAPSTHRGPETLGILVCSRPATKGIRDAIGRSRRGLVWCFVDEEVVVVEEGSIERADHIQNTTRIIIPPKTKLKQFLYNKAAATHCGLEGVDVGMRYNNGHHQHHSTNNSMNSSSSSLSSSASTITTTTNTTASVSSGSGGSGGNVSDSKEVILLFQGRPIMFPTVIS